jgi:N-acetylglucosaminyldiphosphoundecaprenol N-acetyl-beta-D-mannosaminyltransferase
MVLSHLESPARQRTSVLGCPIDALDMVQTLARCSELIARGEFSQHMAINAAKLVAMERDPALRAIVSNCDLINADGQAIVWASKALGDPLPARVAGVDLMYELFDLCEARGYSVYILGAKPSVLETAVARLRERNPSLEIAGYRDGYFADDDAGAVAEEIRRCGADVLFVAISSPRKEYFLGAHGRNTGARFAMGVGGSVDILAGITIRAPLIWQRVGLEWFYRLLQEPRRMFKRYARTNARFTILLVRGMLARASRRSRSTGVRN